MLLRIKDGATFTINGKQYKVVGTSMKTPFKRGDSGLVKTTPFDVNGDVSLTIEHGAERFEVVFDSSITALSETTLSGLAYLLTTLKGDENSD